MKHILLIFFIYFIKDPQNDFIVCDVCLEPRENIFFLLKDFMYSNTMGNIYFPQIAKQKVRLLTLVG